MEGAQRTTFDQPDPVPPSQAPTAVAGATPTTVPEGGVVQLDGSGSSDPENGALRYAWTQITKPYVGLSSASSDSPSFTAPRGLPMPEPRFLVDGHRPNRRRLQAKHGRGRAISLPRIASVRFAAVPTGQEICAGAHRLRTTPWPRFGLSSRTCWSSRRWRAKAGRKSSWWPPTWLI